MVDAETVEEFGRQWSAKLPRGAIAWLLNRTHIATPKEEVAEYNYVMRGRPWPTEKE